jgi:hypothetical protein
MNHTGKYEQVYVHPLSRLGKGIGRDCPNNTLYDQVQWVPTNKLVLILGDSFELSTQANRSDPGITAYGLLDLANKKLLSQSN